MMKFSKTIIASIISITLVILSVIPCFAETHYIENGFEYTRSDGYAKIVGYTGTDTVVEIPLEFGNYTVDTIDMAAFNGNNTITEIKLPRMLKYINSSAFANMTSLKKITIPDFCERISSFAFYNCNNLDSFNILSDKLSVIKESSFYNCDSLESFDVPDGIERIESFAFADCESLETVYIPGSVTEISDSAFSGSNSVCIVCKKDSAADEYAQQWDIEKYYIGDADCSGKFNISDATAIQKYKAGLSQLSKTGLRAADVNGDNQVTVRDATLIQMRIANIINEF